MPTPLDRAIRCVQQIKMLSTCVVVMSMLCGIQRRMYYQEERWVMKCHNINKPAHNKGSSSLKYDDDEIRPLGH